MPEGPLGLDRPLVESRIKLLVFGHPENPPTADEIVNVVSEGQSHRLLQYTNNIVEQNINTNNIEGMASEGVQSLVVIEFESGQAISLSQNLQALENLRESILQETGAGVFLIAD